MLFLRVFSFVPLLLSCFGLKDFHRCSSCASSPSTIPNLCPLCQARATPPLQLFLCRKSTAQPQTQARQETFHDRQLAKMSSAKIKHWPKVNSQAQKHSCSQSVTAVMGQWWTALTQHSDLHTHSPRSCTVTSHTAMAENSYFIRHSLHLPQKCHWGLS